MLSSRGGAAVLRYPLFLAVRWRTGIDLSEVRPADVVTDIQAPVLFVHGDADRQVSVLALGVDARGPPESGSRERALGLARW